MPRQFSSAAIPLRDLPPCRISMINGSRSMARAIARRLRPSLPTSRASSKCAVREFLLPPQTTPSAFEATIALTRSGDELGLVLGNRRENMDRKSIGLREICDEFILVDSEVVGVRDGGAAV